MASKAKQLVNIRRYIRARITRSCNDVDGNFEDFDAVRAAQCLANLRDDLQSIRDSDEKVLASLWDDELSDDENVLIQDRELEVISQYKHRLNNTIAKLERKLIPVVEQIPHNNNSSNVGRLKPETAPLPTYGGKRNESLEKFIFSFEAITSSHQYSEFEKFLLLQKCMTDRADVLLRSLELDRQSYREARNLLESAFASPLSQRYNTLDRLQELEKLNDGDPFILVSEMRQIKESFKRLTIDTDTVLQYFYWRALPEKIKSQIVTITNCSKPDLGEIEENVFRAIERSQDLQVRDNTNESSVYSKRKTSTYAVNVKYESDSKQGDSITCSLCSDNHPYFRCSKYKTANDKLRRLESLGGCVRCGYVNHIARDCKLKNLKCKLCKGPHFPVLCVKQDKGDASKTHERDRKINNNIVLTSNISSEGLALPTFTALVGKNVVRIMRDTGAQATLVSDKLCKFFDFEVVGDNIAITINGFNESKRYVTKMVKVPICLNDRIVTLHALCVPSIDVSLELPGIGKLVSILHGKNYYLADKLLTFNDCTIDNIDIILGADFAYCNPITTLLFGETGSSSLLNTPTGVMIEGSIEKLLRDSQFLKTNSTVINEFSLSVRKQKCSIYDIREAISSSDLIRAADDILNSKYDEVMSCEQIEWENSVEINDNLSKYVLDKAERDTEGRLVLPLMWNSKVQHLLGRNYNLSSNILKTNYKKLSKDPCKLAMTDNVFREQENMGIIERIEDFESFKNENPHYSFLPHMSVFRLNKETTKCRVVFLSNIAENNPKQQKTISHNQAILSGPNLNQRLFISLLLLRFDRYVLIYDLVKAFSMIGMSKVDQARLLLMWYKDVGRGDFSLAVYKAKRLPFGISCAPALLMLALYKILIVDDNHLDENLTHLRKLAYTLLYMDNGGYSCSELSELNWAKTNLCDIFNGYKFSLQQFVSNDDKMQRDLDEESGVETPQIVDLYGMKWDRIKDNLSTSPLNLDPNADTKRLILQTYAENFDIFGFNLPLFNRAKIFIHKLQCSSELSWDSKLNPNQLKEWKLICRQICSCNPISIPRFVGDRNGNYNLVAFTDASKDLFGIVVYLVNESTSTVSFLYAKNKIVGDTLKCKSIPSLELCAVLLGTENLINTWSEFQNDNLLNPINVVKLRLFTDSMISLNWLDGVSNKLSKAQNKLNVFVRNRLLKIETLCETKPITFEFASGSTNPADLVTRCTSIKQLAKTDFHTGPSVLKDPICKPNVLSVTVPCPEFVVNNVVVDREYKSDVSSVLSAERFSSFSRYVRVLALVLRFINRLKCKVVNDSLQDENFHNNAKKMALADDQRKHFSDCVDFLSSANKKPKFMPNLIKQLNVFIDEDGLLRVRSKFKNKLVDGAVYEPILMSKSGFLTQLLIRDLHESMGHSGKYVVLNELRLHYYVPCAFSIVKNILRSCIVCKRFNMKTIALNQSPYRIDRINPPKVPFKFMYMDHFGPFSVKYDKSKVKCYVLLLSCMYTRAFNAELCLDMTVKTFLRAFQMHCHKYGVPSKVTSDSGSTLISGGNTISTFLNDEVVSSYLKEFSISKVEFSYYPKGNSSLGSLVESGVKLYKRLIYGFIRNNVLDFHDFQFIISDANHLVNRRPVALLEATRDSSLEVPYAITPQMLINGYTLPSVNCIQGMEPVEEDPLWDENPHRLIEDSYRQIRSIRQKLLDLYRGEFFAKLVHQAVDEKSRYAPKKHNPVFVGDIVCLKERFSKPNNYPLGIVRETTTNELGEVTVVKVKRGDNSEIVSRHSSCIIPLLQLKIAPEISLSRADFSVQGGEPRKKLQRRKAAVNAAAKISNQV